MAVSKAPSFDTKNIHYENNLSLKMSLNGRFLEPGRVFYENTTSFILFPLSLTETANKGKHVDFAGFS